MRFTYAHEIGHLVIHEEEIKQCQFRSPEEWIHFRQDMSEDDLFWFEQQAYEFAGRLLVPRNQLKKELANQREKINQFKKFSESDDDESLIRAVSRVICDKFDVSDSVIFKRIKNERIWKELNL